MSVPKARTIKRMLLRFLISHRVPGIVESCLLMDILASIRKEPLSLQSMMFKNVLKKNHILEYHISYQLHIAVRRTDMTKKVLNFANICSGIDRRRNIRSRNNFDETYAGPV